MERTGVQSQVRLGSNPDTLRVGCELGTPFNLSGPPLAHLHQVSNNTSYHDKAWDRGSPTFLHIGITTPGESLKNTDVRHSDVIGLASESFRGSPGDLP